MTYAQWIELCRKQAAERQAEPAKRPAEFANGECDPEEADSDKKPIRFLLRHRSWPLSRFPVSRRLLRRNLPGSPQSNIS